MGLRENTKACWFWEMLRRGVRSEIREEQCLDRFICNDDFADVESVETRVSEPLGRLNPALEHCVNPLGLVTGRRKRLTNRFKVLQLLGDMP